jgi:tripartite-type tricarboxylate transporter receptor subunit TctC
MLRSGLTTFVALCALGAAFAADAQSYPSRAVKFVMPAAPGSSPDRVSRLLAERLGRLWGVPVIVENRPGGTGTVGSEYVMRSAPDGYTALFAFTSVIQAPALLPKVPYDIEKDFAPVSLVAYAPVTLSVRADSPFKTLADLLDAARNPAAPLSYGTFGAGSTFHIYGETLRRAANAHMVMVPYKGEALALTDLLGGQIQSTWASLGLVSPHLAAGRVRALAIAQATRSKVAPDVPTFAELGYPQVGVVTWFGALLPAATPRAIVRKMSVDINGVLAQPEVSSSLAQTGIEPAGTTPERFAEVLRRDAARWKQMIREAGITASN